MTDLAFIIFVVINLPIFIKILKLEVSLVWSHSCYCCQNSVLDYLVVLLLWQDWWGRIIYLQWLYPPTYSLARHLQPACPKFDTLCTVHAPSTLLGTSQKMYMAFFSTQGSFSVVLWNRNINLELEKPKYKIWV